MNVRCPSCETTYRVDPAKMPAGGVRARCAVCSSVFAVSAPASAAPVFTPAATPGPATFAPRAAPPPQSPARRSPMTPPTPPIGPPAGMPRPVAPVAPPSGRPAARPAPPAGPPAGPVPARPAAPPAGAPRPAVTPAPAPAPRAPSPARASAPAALAKEMTGPLRPVNPFLVQDPRQKARRLARALISDMIVYHPEKRQQGLREGTLPQLFKDEIDKSWQEYVVQVGHELATGTSYWTEALNEILAGGKRVF